MSQQRYTPLYQLSVSRFREFYREPAAVFWVYIFPLLLAVALGVAFREKPIEKITVTIRNDIGSPQAVAALKDKLGHDERMIIHEATGDEWVRPLGSGKTDLVVAIASNGEYELWDEPNRAGSVLARH